ncbi:MAG: preprotein translocase subunit YajC [Actinobacteria bacterium]|nr:MAG: preprotein translocase subunit YajC [Actinomycetota bacterium]TMK62396.1 MAG: preprotein translocase subunit YajC [Actinomycetota bacterium]
MIQILAQSSGGTSSSGGSLLSLLFPLVLLGGVFYFLLLRPNRTRQRQQQSLLQSLQVGDEVMTAGGIFGTLKDIDEDDDTVTVEIAPGTDVRMLRRAISQRLVEEAEEDAGGDEGTEDQGFDEEAGSRP